MSKTIMIPGIGANPYVVELNGVRYSYAAGTEQTVPDAVAAIIANDMALRPQEDPNVTDLPAAIKAALDALTARVAALEEGSTNTFDCDADLGVDQGKQTLTLDITAGELYAALSDGSVCHLHTSYTTEVDEETIEFAINSYVPISGTRTENTGSHEVIYTFCMRIFDAELMLADDLSEDDPVVFSQIV